MGRDAMKCPKCQVTLRVSWAIAQTWRASPGDRLDDGIRTMSPGGPGKLVRALKCPSCGYSVTPGADDAKPDAA